MRSVAASVEGEGSCGGVTGVIGLCSNEPVLALEDPQLAGPSKRGRKDGSGTVRRGTPLNLTSLSVVEVKFTRCIACVGLELGGNLINRLFCDGARRRDKKIRTHVLGLCASVVAQPPARSISDRLRIS